MAHQCLKCGRSYPDGSPQILKGCEGCKGTRFFYTDKPLDEAARTELADQTDIDIERLALGKGAGDARRPRKIPTKAELPVGREREKDHDWVAGGPTYLRNVVEDVVRRAESRKPVFRVGAPGTDEAIGTRKTLAEWVRENAGADDEAPAEPALGATDERAVEEVDELLDDLLKPEREAEWRRQSVEPTSEPPAPQPDAPAAKTPTPADEDVVYARSRPVPKPISLVGHAIEAEEDARLRAEAQAARERAAPSEPTPRPKVTAASGVEESLYPEGQVPETVAVPDAGVYELDVKRLLEKSPIVVHKDGTYSLHLPSLMETLERKGRR